MKKALFTGACTALVTPFKNNEINYAAMESILQRQIDAGISSVVIAGTTGEAPTLTDSEKLDLFRKCRNYVGNKLKIIAGTGCNDTAHTVFLSQMAEETGVDGILAVCPYYNKPTASGLVAHYTAVANAVKLPIILYNVPSRTGSDIPIGVYRELSNVENIIGVKEASGSIGKIVKIRAHCPEDFYIWSGNDEMAVPVISAGGIGVISVISNIFPKDIKEMIVAALNGDFRKAAAMQCRMHDLSEILFCEANPIPVKAAMKIIGYDCGSCRLPLTDLGTVNHSKLKRIIDMM